MYYSLEYLPAAKLRRTAVLAETIDEETIDGVTIGDQTGMKTDGSRMNMIESNYTLPPSPSPNLYTPNI